MSSGLGIGGAGSDDYTIHTERDELIAHESTKTEYFGANGERWDDACATCGRITVVCNDCDSCERHCTCYQH